jgi:hypothetical protein
MTKYYYFDGAVDVEIKVDENGNYTASETRTRANGLRICVNSNAAEIKLELSGDEVILPINDDAKKQIDDMFKKFYENSQK